MTAHTTVNNLRPGDEVEATFNPGVTMHVLDIDGYDCRCAYVLPDSIIREITLHFSFLKLLRRPRDADASTSTSPG